MKKIVMSVALIGALALVTACGAETETDSTSSVADAVNKTVKDTANAADKAVADAADAADEAVADMANAVPSADLQTLTFSVSGMT